MKVKGLLNPLCRAALLLSGCVFALSADAAVGAHPVPKDHPRLFGSRERLQTLAKERPADYRRTVTVARQGYEPRNVPAHAKMMSLALVSAIERDRELGRRAIAMAMRYIDGPIRKGHETFGHDLARCAVVYDLCYEYWTKAERVKFHRYMNRTVAANLKSETAVFHNGWWGYKNWGIGLACYATTHENPHAPRILTALKRDYQSRAVPALELAGAGGGWAEGYYINSWLYEWLMFCEVARHCEGLDLYALAPKFFKSRAIAGMFETYPGIRKYKSRRSIPMGDGGGRLFGGERDKALSARRILVNRFRDDLPHQAVHTFNETTPTSGVAQYAYKDFLWRDRTVTKGDLKNFKLSHLSRGPGYVYARSSWDEDATYFFFKCGDRFTAHQHLDVGHFLIYKHQELAGDGGHYDSFDTPHTVNYYMRTVAHNTMLIRDPSETWSKGLRALRNATVGADGGQRHNWPNHNGSVVDVKAWRKKRKLYDIADLLAFEDRGKYLYVAGNCTRAYSPKKLQYFTRQIVFIRPGTFIIFDRVRSTHPKFKKTWLLQAMKPPTGEAPDFVITNGRGKLTVQTLLPKNPRVKLVTGEAVNGYGRQTWPPEKTHGPGVECRIEISPSKPAKTDYFLNVLTATDGDVESVPQATVRQKGTEITVTVGDAQVTFKTRKFGGRIELPGVRAALARKIVPAK